MLWIRDGRLFLSPQFYSLIIDVFPETPIYADHKHLGSILRPLCVQTTAHRLCPFDSELSMMFESMNSWALFWQESSVENSSIYFSM